MIQKTRYSIIAYICIGILYLTSCDLVHESHYEFNIHNKTDRTVTVYFSDAITLANYAFSRDSVVWKYSIPSTVIDVKPDSMLKFMQGTEGWPENFEEDGVTPIWVFIDSLIIDGHLVNEKWKDQETWYSYITDDKAVYDLYIRSSSLFKNNQ